MFEPVGDLSGFGLLHYTIFIVYCLSEWSKQNNFDLSVIISHTHKKMKLIFALIFQIAAKFYFRSNPEKTLFKIKMLLNTCDVAFKCLHQIAKQQQQQHNAKIENYLL